MTPTSEQDHTLVDIFCSRASQRGQRAALQYPYEGGYRTISWAAWSDSVKKTALGLHALRVKKGDRIGLLSENRPEWTFVDLGALSLGAIVVPIYPTSIEEDTAYIVNNAGIEVMAVSTEEQLRCAQNLFQKCPSLRHLIHFDPVPSEDPRLTSMTALLRLGNLESLNNPKLYEQTVAAVCPDDVATLIYTSGTTGPPKGVMLTHRNFVMNYLSAKEAVSITDEDVSISFLPLSHVFERLAGYYFMAFQGAVIAYARSMKTVPEDILIVRPTVGAAVPRFYEKIYAKILEKVGKAPPWVRKIFNWAIRLGCEVAQKKMRKEPLSLGLRIRYRIARLVAFKKLQKALGGRIRYFISGGAPLLKELAEFFYAADVLILEGYGLTETAPVIAVNTPDDPRFGTVGRPLSVAQVKIAGDGEILTQGPCVMKGYYRNEEATREAIRDGWFHTGDIGEIDSDGFLKITDRKKDIIVTSGGKNISPQNIEGLILRDPTFLQAVVVGDKRNYLVALVSVNRLECENYARSRKIPEKEWGEWIVDETLLDWIRTKVEGQTRHLPSHEQIKYVGILPQELSQEEGELTPTLKVKRKVVMNKYQPLIEGLYKKGEAYQAG